MGGSFAKSCVVFAISAAPFIWARSRQDMSVAWRARTAHEWEYYFATYTHEAIHRCIGVPQDMERFLHVRRGMSGNALPVSLGERARRKSSALSFLP